MISFQEAQELKKLEVNVNIELGIMEDETITFDFGWDNYWTYNNMQVQMMGSYNVSFYKLLDTELNIVSDSKSRTSFYYHLPVTNYPRGALNVRFIENKAYLYIDNTETTTYQNYIFLTQKN